MPVISQNAFNGRSNGYLGDNRALACIFCMLTHCNFEVKFSNRSAKVTSGHPELQIRYGALKPSNVSSILMHFHQFNITVISFTIGI